MDCLKDTKGLTVRETLNTIIAVEGKSLVNDKARAKQRSLPDLFFIRDMLVEGLNGESDIAVKSK